MQSKRLMSTGFAAIALLGAGCAGEAAAPSPFDAGPATLTIHLTDAPGDVLEAWVTIDQVYLQGTGGRVVLRDEPYTVDLATLENTSTVLLEDVEVPDGNYGQLRFVVSGACLVVDDNVDGQDPVETRVYATSQDYAGCPEGTEVYGELRTPSFSTSGLKVTLPEGGLTLLPGGSMNLLVDFNVAESFGHQAGNSGAWVMHPVIRATSVTTERPVSVTLALGEGVTLPTDVTLAAFSAALSTNGGEPVILPFEDPDEDGIFTASFGFMAEGSYELQLTWDDATTGIATITTTPELPYAFDVPGEAMPIAITITGWAPPST